MECSLGGSATALSDGALLWRGRMPGDKRPTGAEELSGELGRRRLAWPGPANSPTSFVFPLLCQTSGSGGVWDGDWGG